MNTCGSFFFFPAHVVMPRTVVVLLLLLAWRAASLVCKNAELQLDISTSQQALGACRVYDL
jgi:hypothetical protein